MPEKNTVTEQRWNMQNVIDDAAANLVESVNMQAVRFYKLQQARSDRVASAPYIADIAQAWRQSIKDTNKIIDQMIQLYISFFEFLDRNPEANNER